MHIVFDNEGTLNYPGKKEDWKKLKETFREKGYTTSIATSGFFMEDQEKLSGFKKEEFDKVYEAIMKNGRFFKQVAADFNENIENICVIDNDQFAIQMADLVGAKAFLFRGDVADTEHQLIEKNVL